MAPANKALRRIEVCPKGDDPVADSMRRRLRRAVPNAPIESLVRVDVVTIAGPIEESAVRQLAAALANPLSRHVRVDAPVVDEGFDVAIEVGYLPGVTDNTAHTISKMLADAGHPLAAGASVHTSRLFLLRGAIGGDTIEAIGAALRNPLIERIDVKTIDIYRRDRGMDAIAPRVVLTPHPRADLVSLEVDEAELARIGREGIAEPEGGARRGPLALDATAMRTIRDFFRAEGRPPTDVELESIAQNWSEHCRHLLFNSPIDDVEEGLFRRFIRGATEAVRRARGGDDICVSVFSDNAGAIAFDDAWLVTDKVETHNSPSALDPLGGALTGILGVNRDALGFGLGARPILNRYGFCLPYAGDDRTLYRRRDADGAPREPLCEPVRLAEGIFDGVEVGGNCSGIPTPQGFLHFHEGYRAKPLVFVGTLGLIPREVGGRRLHEKRARPGDHIVVVGGRVGLDGIHGATFSSEALASGSPATAVQIGDPITQKLVADALLREARDAALYTSLTDNGAGGLSCSVTEMAREAGGCEVDLDRVPLKYPGLAPWQIWVSESQERMTLAVPKEHVLRLIALFASREVEATDIGTFTASGRCVVRSRGDVVMDLPLDFVHDGWPRVHLSTRAPAPPAESPDPARPRSGAELGEALCALLRHPNLASHEEVARRFDHEVQGATVSKPMVGAGNVCADATAIRPLCGDEWRASWRAVVVSQALAPAMTEIDAHAMAMWCVDLAVRRVVAAGASPERTALLDNFCWSSPQRPERLFLLKEACRGCHDGAVAFGAPFISGKDSMHNDFAGYDAQGNAVALSVPPTLLISSLAVVEDARALVSLDAKSAGDGVVLVGRTGAAMGGAAYRFSRGLDGGAAPRFDAPVSRRACEVHAAVVRRGLVASSIAIGVGGLLVAAARSALAGAFGMTLDFAAMRAAGLATDEVDDCALAFAESPGRFLLTCAPNHEDALVEAFAAAEIPCARIGRVSASGRLRATGLLHGDEADVSLAAIDAAYRTDWRLA
jgi:phosphoribosylformylglycinamidine synthase